MVSCVAALGDQVSVYRAAGYSVLVEIPTMNEKGIPGRIRIPFRTALEAIQWAEKVPWILDVDSLQAAAI